MIETVGRLVLGIAIGVAFAGPISRVSRRVATTGSELAGRAQAIVAGAVAGARAGAAGPTPRRTRAAAGSRDGASTRTAGS